jgi:2-polyprenyl-6-hydroxyphenyl methylase/3-demethylubiquinone-9 3-methyltransferase
MESRRAKLATSIMTTFPTSAVSKKTGMDTGSHPAFFDYYAQQSESAATRNRFLGIRDTALRVLAGRDPAVLPGPLDVADIGCGAGTQSIMWAEMGHRVHGVDINQPLLDLARRRAEQCGREIEFCVGSAAALPWPDRSMDVCLAPELLEHVHEWRECLQEFARVLRPGGVLVLTTNNKLCPIQQEFNLPLYSWYPAALKHRYERLAVTTRPEVANYATYPAVNWFTPYSLAAELDRLGLDARDRFDLLALWPMSVIRRSAIGLLRSIPLLRFLGHVLTPYTVVAAVRRA